MTVKQMKLQSAANERKAARQAAHRAMMAQQTERRDAIAAYNRYWSAWLRGGRKGPKPVKPSFM